MARVTHIELLIETSTSWGRQLVDGINQFAKSQTHWQLGIFPAGRNEYLRIKKSWTGDGVIARINSEELADDIRNAGVPAVNVSTYTYGLPDIPQCTSNERIVGELAAAHLMDCGLTNFAYYGPSDRPGYEDRVGSRFVSVLEERGYHCHIKNRLPGAREHSMRQGGVEPQLVQWMRLLPGPIGLFTWSDMEALRIIEACKEANRDVPNDIAVLSGETDDLMASIASPNISSIDHAPQTVGYEAARLLQQMLNGHHPAQPTKHIPPKGIIRNGSTDIFTIDDEHVTRAIAFIKNNLSIKFSVKDVSDYAGISRRVLEERFRKHVGRSPAAEIRRYRIDRAKRLILTTDKPLSEISAACGFDFAETFTRTFSRETGETPMQYRSAARLKRSEITSGL